MEEIIVWKFSIRIHLFDSFVNFLQILSESLQRRKKLVKRRTASYTIVAKDKIFVKKCKRKKNISCKESNMNV